MTLVADASVLAEYLLGTAVGGEIAEMFHRDPSLHVPHLAVVEVVSVLRGWVRAGHVTRSRAEAALDDLSDLPAMRWPADPLLPRIWALRDNLSAYDATYVALAEALDATLVTADARLARAVPGETCRIELVRNPT